MDIELMKELLKLFDKMIDIIDGMAKRVERLEDKVWVLDNT